LSPCAIIRQLRTKRLSYLGESDMPETNYAPSSQPTISYGQSTRRNGGLYTSAGVLCAIIGAFIFPEILCSAAIILGGYAWRLDCSQRNNRGLVVIIVGIIAMLIGLYYIAYITVGDFLP